MLGESTNPPLLPSPNLAPNRKAEEGGIGGALATLGASMPALNINQKIFSESQTRACSNGEELGSFKACPDCLAARQCTVLP